MRSGSTRKPAKHRADSPDPTLDQADYERLAEFRYLLRHFLVFSERAAEEVGLTAQQHQALLAIKASHGRGSPTIGALADRLAILPHSAVGLVDRLATKGLIRRTEGHGDRRHVLIELTDKSEGLLAGLSVAHRDELKRLAPLLRALLSGIG